MSTAHTQPLVSDAAERALSLDPHRSFLVQAPAGSGKTELLVLRYLALLPHVEEPEQILAITFTRKATAEMRVRVLRALESSRHDDPFANDHEQDVRRLAKAALAHAEARGWQITEQPQRLNIQTIDSLALSIASQMPLLSRLGGQLTPVDDATPLYALAAERTMAQLGNRPSPELAEALSDLLKLRDASLYDCEALIAGMLARRDQWLLLLPGIVRPDQPWEELKRKLEEPFRREHERAMGTLHNELARTPGVLEDLLDLARIAYANGQQQLSELCNIQSASDLTDIAHWQCLCHLLLTNDGEWRSAINAKAGFPANTHRAYGLQLKSIIQRLSSNETLFRELRNVRKVPPAAYSPEEWRTVRNIFIVLRHAIAQLRVIFAEQNVIDFSEAGIGARAALENPSVLMRLDERVQHLLVDEFQDTSRPHFALLQMLLDDWQAGDGRTCFFVGDPMQSIYLFRDAESRLFSQVREHGIERPGTALPLKPMQLSTNFRSLPAIVNPLNEIFERVLTNDPEDDVSYVPSISSRNEPREDIDALHLHIQTRDRDTQSRDELNASEADAMISVIRGRQPAIEEARRQGTTYRVAVLARARPHLAAIIARLQRENISFRGVNIDLLQDRQEILDLLSLLRALLHPADRIAWLAVLRAPWCGLTIPALHAICGDPESTDQRQSIPALLREHHGRLDPESRGRALHVLSILEQAQAAYAAGALAGSPAGLALWLERTWHALGAPHYLEAESLSNCEAFFAALAEMPPSCFGTLDESLHQRLKELYAQPNPAVSEDCGVQLMTIHQAKGLEFEVVLVPQLQRPGKADDPPLFHWLIQRRADSAEEELLLAPIGYKHSDNPRLYDWVGKKSSRRFQQEEKRLLYVACSRAIHELHLFATIDRKQNGDLALPPKNTLLAAGWPGLEQRILEATQPVSAATVITIPRSPTSNTVVTTIAAVSERPRQTLRRLPKEFFPDTVPEAREAPIPAGISAGLVEDAGIAGRLARIQGIVLHALLERAASGTSGQHPDWGRLADALLRQYGLMPADAATARKAVLRGIENTLAHEEGRWLLLPRDSARGGTWTEMSWSMAKDGRVIGRRPDRVFLGGASPNSPGTDYLWIVDYKTAPLAEGADRNAFLTASREQYRSQLEAYSALFRNLRDLDEIAATREHRLAIYHPMLPWLDWWPA
jgi:ATP-dependent helicase/nuclease subunit A